MLQRVHSRVVQSALVEKGQVPDREIGRPHRQRDQRMREHAQAVDDPQAQERLQHRPRHAYDETERGEVAEQDVLDHVHEQEFLLAEVVDRRDEGDQDEPDSRPEQEPPPARHGRPAAAERADALCV